MKKNWVLFVLSFVVALVATELFWRSFRGQEVLALKDWLSAETVDATLGHNRANRYDPNLGWVLKDNFSTNPGMERPMMTTTSYGIRKNDKNTEVRKNSILAVGDSFTAGSEVYDDESWPSHLEQALARQVLNAGVGAYGFDQIILRAEELLPILEPNLVIIGLLDQDILRNGFRKYGAPKPWFSVKEEKLVRHNLPVPDLSSYLDSKIAEKDSIFIPWSYSLFLVELMQVFDDSISYKKHGGYKLVDNDEVQISCLLLKRLRNRLSEFDSDAIIVLQYGGQIFSLKFARPQHAIDFLKCARELNYPIVDEFDYLTDVADSISELKRHYMMHSSDGQAQDIYGHMSSYGNEKISGLIAAEILKQNYLDK
jgi:lysophospholipase L1-like esterase